MTDWKENERKHIIQALNRIADNLGRIANEKKPKTAEWYIHQPGLHECTRCGFKLTVGTRYCPGCGSEMKIKREA